MAVARIIAATAAGLLLTALGGCVTTQGNLTSSADRLEHNSDALAQDLRDESTAADYPSGYSQDARDLAEQSHDFRRTVEDRSASDGDVKAAFEHLSHSYHALRDDVDRSESHAAKVDLRPVTEAYLDVERGMGGYPAHRYARGEDTHDSY
ncbi:MAG: hypothetical protein ACREVV_05050 [Steroidobacteraceae bacterium]